MDLLSIILSGGWKKGSRETFPAENSEFSCMLTQLRHTLKWFFTNRSGELQWRIDRVGEKRDNSSFLISSGSSGTLIISLSLGEVRIAE